MPEEVLFKTESTQHRGAIADTLTELAGQIGDGTVRLTDDGNETTVTIPSDPRFEVELERLTDSETGEQRYELEFEIRWRT